MSKEHIPDTGEGPAEEPEAIAAAVAVELPPEAEAGGAGSVMRKGLGKALAWLAGRPLWFWREFRWRIGWKPKANAGWWEERVWEVEGEPPLHFSRPLTEDGETVQRREKTWLEERGPRVEERAGDVGLALSGGGIRSATFNLGILQVLSRLKLGVRDGGVDEEEIARLKAVVAAEEQALALAQSAPKGLMARFTGKAVPPEKLEEAERKKDVAQKELDLAQTRLARRPRSLLERVDFLSSVSGGGYLACWYLTCLFHGFPKEDEAVAPGDGSEREAGENRPGFLHTQADPVRHLRRYSNYLTPQKSLMSPDTWTAASIWARNTLLVQLMVWSTVITGLLLVRAVIKCNASPEWGWLSVLGTWLRKAGQDFWWAGMGLVSWLAGGVTWLLHGVQGKLHGAALALGIVSHPPGGWRWLADYAGAALLGWAFAIVCKELRSLYLTPGEGMKRTPMSQNAVVKWSLVPMFLSAAFLGVTLESIVTGKSGAGHVIAKEKAIGAIAVIEAHVSAVVGGEVPFKFPRVIREVTPQMAGQTAKTLGVHELFQTPWVGGAALFCAAASAVFAWLTCGKKHKRGSGVDLRWWLVTIAPVLSGVLVSFFIWVWWMPGLESTRYLAASEKPPAGIMVDLHDWLHALSGWKAGLAGGAAVVAVLWSGVLPVLTGLAAGGVAMLFIYVWMHLHKMAEGEVVEKWFDGSPANGLMMVGSGLWVLLAVRMVVIIATGMLGRDMAEERREWLSRYGGWMNIGISLWAGALLLAYGGPHLVEWLLHGDHPWLKWGAVGSWLASTIWGNLLAKSPETSGKRGSSPLKEWMVPVLTGVALLGMLVAVSWVVNGMLGGGSTWDAHTFSLKHWAACIGGSGALALILLKRVDLNEFSMNRFYRNRLMQAYMGAGRVKFPEIGDDPEEKGDRRPHPFTGFDEADDVALAAFDDQSKLRRQNAPLPYPILNGAINTSGGSELDTQERKAESFIFSPLFCGAEIARLPSRLKNSALCAYRRTADYARDEGAVPPTPADLSLGTAMSISGAAAAPNGGYHTSPTAAFLMTLFNARLGWWLPNPGWTEDQTVWKGAQPSGDLTYKTTGWLKCLIAELTGSATPDNRMIYVSDGGHFENLGIYELIRRRCKLIICGDGEQDENLTFFALGTAIRRCRVDFDVEIKINVDAIRKRDDEGQSGAPCAIGKIFYPDRRDDEDFGTLIYIKLCVTGGETTDVKQYRSADDKFPHDPTLPDQWFGESEFESYRKLGEISASKALQKVFDQTEEELAGEDSALFTKFAGRLHDFWEPASAGSRNGAFARHTQTLAGLWNQLAGRPEMKEFHEFVLPKFEEFKAKASALIVQADVPGGGPPAADTAAPGSRIHSAGYFCQQLIQLMENVYLDLELDDQDEHPDNSGWVELFKHWVRAPVLRAGWESSRETYGRRFQTFVDSMIRESGGP